MFDFGGESVAVIRTATEEGGGIYSCLVPDDEDIPEPSDGDGKYNDILRLLPV